MDVESTDTPTETSTQPRLFAPWSKGWRLVDIDVRFAFKVQHYGTIIWGILITVALAISRWVQKPTIRPFLNYDATVSYINSEGDTVPSAAAVLVPFAVLIINLVFYEFFVFRYQNKTITHAVATFLHFLADAICCFVTVVFITEVTKFAAGRLRPDFLQFCQPPGGLDGQAAQLSFAESSACTVNDPNGRKSFPSGHASSSSVTMVYSIVYNLWAGYFRGNDAAFMGINRQSGWRGGHRILREIGHGAYLVWNLMQFGFFWAVGTTRFMDNKHHVGDIVAGWFLGLCIALIFSIRAVVIHKYVTLDFVF